MFTRVCTYLLRNVVNPLLPISFPVLSAHCSGYVTSAAGFNACWVSLGSQWHDPELPVGFVLTAIPGHIIQMQPFSQRSPRGTWRWLDVMVSFSLVLFYCIWWTSSALSHKKEEAWTNYDR